uniref:Uncharacterized protein n=1 Tax=Anguilla anguilla TaxID=7936 RepID=A0A0E9VVS3_ANGAN
MKRCVPIGYI